MMSPRACLCLFAALAASANGDYAGRCPFLKKVVPQGQVYVDIASDLLHLRATDCAAYAEKYSEHFNFTHGDFEAHSQADMKTYCSSRPIPATATPSLTSVFPAFTDNEMLFDLRVGNYPAVARVHFCPSTKKITRAKVFSIETVVPEAAKKIGSLILSKIYQEHDCSVLGDLMDEESSVAFHGEPSALTRGQENVFRSAGLARSFCEAKVATERRIHIQDAVVVNNYFYDDIHKELVLVGVRTVEVKFAPGKVRTHPIAASLKISLAGKVRVTEVHFYETDVVHIESKYGSIPSYPAHQVAHEAHIKASIAERNNVPNTALEDSMLSSISGAIGVFSGSWCQITLLLLSIAFTSL